MKYRVIPVTPFEQNCTLLWCEKTRHGAVVDPGGDVPRILAAIAEEGVTVDKLLITHGHIDHAGAAAELAKKLNVQIEGPHADDAFLLDELPRQSQRYGFPLAAPFTPSRWLKDGDSIQIGEEKLTVLHTPGHTPGHVVFFAPNVNLALVGDVLFRGSIGRTDFPRGDFSTLIASIREKLLPLGDDVAFISGHGPMSTFGKERRSNPFLIDNNG
ncbi:MBL fold metallo-hydrolase [Candidatus Ferrigenium straubiae]|jgi:glyoxylase-like metal-dependent hydrolase (beta-lactamase superfamily II)|uniref:MBL fold metallo-hydrolase n=1 Tax=Candidatus Ferrigenium straubiae TaxID=2919506 RepID=UPI003F4AB59C